jgi:hypothetical protein
MPFEEISVEMYALLLDADIHESFARELRMLTNVEEFYERNPGFEQLFDSRGTSDDDLVRKLEARILHPHPDDAEVLLYLNRSQFVFAGRLQFVFERFEQTKAVGKVRCPRCEQGRMWRTPRNCRE